MSASALTPRQEVAARILAALVGRIPLAEAAILGQATAQQVVDGSNLPHLVSFSVRVADALLRVTRPAVQPEAFPPAIAAELDALADQLDGLAGPDQVAGDDPASGVDLGNCDREVRP